MSKQQARIQEESSTSYDMDSTLEKTFGFENEKGDIDISKLKPDIKYMLSMTFCCGFSAIQYGSLLSSSGTAWPAIAALFGYDPEEEGVFAPKTILAAAGILGIAVGSVIGGSLIVNGRRKPIIISNMFVIIGSLISIVPNFPGVVIGRLILGFATGVLLSAAPKVLEETIPARISDYGFSASPNLFINFGILVSFGLGPIIEAKSQEELKTDNVWRGVFVTPIIYAVIALFMNLAFHKNDSITFHVQRNEKDQAVNMIRKLYSSKTHKTCERIFDQMRATFELNNEATKDEEKPNLKQVITDVRYRSATFMCCMIAVFQQMSGVMILNIYARKILIETDKSKTMFITVDVAAILIGLGGFVGAVLGNFVVFFTGRRGTFIGGHSLMLVCFVIIPLSITYEMVNVALVFILIFMVVFQSTNGTAFWVYTTEIGEDAAMGLCLCVLMGLLFIVTLVAESFINAVGITGFFYTFAGIQLFTVLYLWFFQKESKGLSSEEKKNLFYKSRAKKIEEFDIKNTGPTPTFKE